jgi:hypothetical protein
MLYGRKALNYIMLPDLSSTRIIGSARPWGAARRFQAVFNTGSADAWSAKAKNTHASILRAITGVTSTHSQP